MARPSENLMVHCIGTTVYVSKQASEALLARCAEVRRKSQKLLTQRKTWGKTGPNLVQRDGETMLWIHAYHELFRKNDFSPVGECAVPKDIWITLNDMVEELMCDIENACINNGPYKKKLLAVQNETAKKEREEHSENIIAVIAEKFMQFLNLTRKVDAKDYVYTTMPTDFRVILISTIFVDAIRSAVAPRVNTAYRTGSFYFQMLAKNHEFVSWCDSNTYRHPQNRFSGKIIDSFYERIFSLFRYKLLTNCDAADGVEMLLHAVSHSLCKWALESGICCDIQADKEGEKRFVVGTPTMPYKLYWYPCHPDTPGDGVSNSRDVRPPKYQPSTVKEHVPNKQLPIADDIEFLSIRKPTENPSAHFHRLLAEAKDRGPVSARREEVHAPLAPVRMQQHQRISEAHVSTPYRPPLLLPSSPPTHASPCEIEWDDVRPGNQWQPQMPAPKSRYQPPSASSSASSSRRSGLSAVPVNITNASRNNIPSNNNNISSGSNNRQKRPNLSPDGSPPPAGLPSQAKRIAEQRKREESRTEFAKARELAVKNYGNRAANPPPTMLRQTAVNHAKASAAVATSSLPSTNNVIDTVNNNTHNTAERNRTMNPFESPSPSFPPTSMRSPNSLGKTSTPLTSSARTASPLPTSAVPLQLTPPFSSTRLITLNADNNATNNGQADDEFDADRLLIVDEPPPLPQTPTPVKPTQPKRVAERPILHFDITEIAPTVPTIEETRSSTTKRRTNSGRTSSSGRDTREGNERSVSTISEKSTQQKVSPCSTISTTSERTPASSSTSAKPREKPKSTAATSSTSGDVAKRDSRIATSSEKQQTASVSARADTSSSNRASVSLENRDSCAERVKDSVRRNTTGGENDNNGDGLQGNKGLLPEAKVVAVKPKDKFVIPKRRKDSIDFREENADEVFNDDADVAVDLASVNLDRDRVANNTTAVDFVVEMANVSVVDVDQAEVLTGCSVQMLDEQRNDADLPSSVSLPIVAAAVAVDDVERATPPKDPKQMDDTIGGASEVEPVSAKDLLSASGGSNIPFELSELSDKEDFARKYQSFVNEMHAKNAELQREKEAAIAERRRKKRQQRAASRSAERAAQGTSSNDTALNEQVSTSDGTANTSNDLSEPGSLSVYDFVSSQQVEDPDGFANSRKRRSKTQKTSNSTAAENGEKRVSVLRFGREQDLVDDQLLPHLPDATVDLRSLGDADAASKVLMAATSLIAAESADPSCSPGSDNNDDQLVRKILVNSGFLEVPLVQTVPQPTSSSGLRSRSMSREERKISSNVKYIERLVSGFDENTAQQNQRRQQQLQNMGVKFDSKMKRPEDVHRVQLAAAVKEDDDFFDFAKFTLLLAAESDSLVSGNNDDESHSNG